MGPPKPTVPSHTKYPVKTSQRTRRRGGLSAGGARAVFLVDGLSSIVISLSSSSPAPLEPFRQLHGIVVCPEMHEEQRGSSISMWLCTAVTRFHFPAAPSSPDLLHSQQHESLQWIAAFVPPVGWKFDCRTDAHGGGQPCLLPSRSRGAHSGIAKSLHSPFRCDPGPLHRFLINSQRLGRRRRAARIRSGVFVSATAS